MPFLVVTGVEVEVKEELEPGAAALTFWLVTDPKKTTKGKISRLNINSSSFYFLRHGALK